MSTYQESGCWYASPAKPPGYQEEAFGCAVDEDKFSYLADTNVRPPGCVPDSLKLVDRFGDENSPLHSAVPMLETGPDIGTGSNQTAAPLAFCSSLKGVGVSQFGWSWSDDDGPQYRLLDYLPESEQPAGVSHKYQSSLAAGQAPELQNSGADGRCCNQETSSNFLDFITHEKATPADISGLISPQDQTIDNILGRFTVQYPAACCGSDDELTQLLLPPLSLQNFDDFEGRTNTPVSENSKLPQGAPFYTSTPVPTRRSFREEAGGRDGVFFPYHDACYSLAESPDDLMTVACTTPSTGSGSTPCSPGTGFPEEPRTHRSPVKLNRHDKRRVFTAEHDLQIEKFFVSRLVRKATSPPRLCFLYCYGTSRKALEMFAYRRWC
jgi:hypothetical protein